MARLYIEGKRKKYFNPFSFLVLMVAIALIFILKFESLVLLHRNVNAANADFLHFVFKYFNIFIFTLCPMNALLTWLFFRRSNMNYIENLVLAAYMGGQIMFYNCLLLILSTLFTSAMGVIGIVLGILIICWSVIAILQFFETKSFRHTIKAIFVIVISQSLSQGLIYITFAIYKRQI